jgi:heme/copper-type cytochrome/quinol oxidase subunit 2
MSILAGVSLLIVAAVIVTTYTLIIFAVARHGRLPASGGQSMIASGSARREIMWTILPAVILLGFLLVSARAAGFFGVP